MSPTASAVPDEFLDDSAERPQARGPRRRTVSEGPAAGHEVLSNPTSARISRVAGLSRRKRKLSQDQPVAPADVRQVKKLLGR